MKTASVAKKVDTAKVADVAKPALAIVPDAAELMFHIISQTDESALIAKGFKPDLLRRNGERVIALDTKKGVLLPDAGYGDGVKDILIRGKIVGTTCFAATEHNLLVSLVRVEGRTYWNLVKDGRLFTFFIQGTAKNEQEAILQLMENNLGRGKDTFELTAGRAPLFFFELLRTVTPKDCHIELKLRSQDQEGTGKLYFFRNDVKRTILNIGGFCYDFNYVNFPTYLTEALSRARVSAGKAGAVLEKKLKALPTELGSLMKPAQTKRSDKKLAISEEERQALVADVHKTLQSVRERAHELEVSKPTKVMQIKAKQSKPAQGSASKKAKK